MTAPISCLRFGQGGHRVLFLAGWLGTAQDWGAVLQAMDPNAVSACLPDIRGYGARRGESGNFSFSEVAQDVQRILDQLGWDNCTLVGHSMGAMAMQRVLADAGQRVRALVGIAPVPACGSRMDAQRFAAFEAAAHDVAGRQAIVAASTGQRLSANWAREVARASCQRSSEDAVVSYLNEWARKGFEDEIAGSACPVRLFVGQHDPGLTRAAIERTWLRWYSDAIVEELPNSGHYPMFETPVWLGTRLEATLRELA
ncbi:alpha/beta hydrolase [Variovorax sp. J22P271]|uniref:alpha/beta fold hydrolase n=1 Tax=Variovorax davisae TaxID=3053515 RepID=UPI0025754117|nr:alpha/beta hydrolase [Variovorax sp. J22P271]MDM0032047.1 alpha/beta hydrolase [Variovorax sp. J22P271]